MDDNLRGNGGERRVAPRRAPATVVALCVVATACQSSDDEPQRSSARRARATVVSPATLAATARSVGHPVYWAGPIQGLRYELSRTQDGRVYIRYLPRDVAAGSSSASYLTVGTYPQENAFATLRATARKQGVRTIPLAGGGLAFQYKGRPTNVYLAYPGSDLQIEVFDPSPARARELVVGGRITPLGTPSQARPVEASVEELSSLAAELRHPLYWAGPRPRTTYELTRTRSGSVYVRYLPSGVRVGDPRARFLTVGTYPRSGAAAAVEARAAAAGAAAIPLAGGGVAYVDAKRPTSVYAAFADADVEVEVFDPVPGAARDLVISGRITRVR